MFKSRVNKANKKRRSSRKNLNVNLYTDVITIQGRTDNYIDVYTTIKSLAQHIEFSKVFQQFSLNRITVIMFPVTMNVNNNTPPIIRISLSTYSNGGGVDPDLNSKGKTVCNFMRPVSISFTNSGRQNDFHYFYDTANLDVGPSCAVLLGNMIDPSTTYTLTYHIQLIFNITYRIPCLISGNREMVQFIYKPKGTAQLEDENNKDEESEEEKVPEKKKKKKNYM
jgi:hypothetical protein